MKLLFFTLLLIFFTQSSFANELTLSLGLQQLPEAKLELPQNLSNYLDQINVAKKNHPILYKNSDTLMTVHFTFYLQKISEHRKLYDRLIESIELCIPKIKLNDEHKFLFNPAKISIPLPQNDIVSATMCFEEKLQILSKITIHKRKNRDCKENLFQNLENQSNLFFEKNKNQNLTDAFKQKYFASLHRYHTCLVSQLNTINFSFAHLPSDSLWEKPSQKKAGVQEQELSTSMEFFFAILLSLLNLLLLIFLLRRKK